MDAKRMLPDALLWLLIAGVLAGCDIDGGVSDPPHDVTILKQITGQDAGTDLPVTAIIQTAAGRDAIGSDQLNTLNVNFRGQSLIVISLGQRSTGGHWVRIESIRQVSEELIVHAVINRPGKDQITTQMLTHPFAAVVINKTGATKVLLNSEDVVGWER